MYRKNFPVRREQRQTEATQRQVERNKRSSSEQLQVIADKLGMTVAALPAYREVTRLRNGN